MLSLPRTLVIATGFALGVSLIAAPAALATPLPPGDTAHSPAATASSPLGSPAGQRAGTQPVSFGDPLVERDIRSTLSIADGIPVTPADLLRLRTLAASMSLPAGDAQRRGYTSLEGLQGATNLRYLWAGVSDDLPRTTTALDLSPLADLTQLSEFSASNVGITDVRPLAGLHSLTYLSLYRNAITEVAPLASLTQLNNLSLTDNQVSSIAELNSLTHLTKLSIGNNKLTDLAGVETMSELTQVWAAANQIRDLSAIAKLPVLDWVGIDNNQVSDISALATLPELRTLTAKHNRISDLRPLNDVLTEDATFEFSDQSVTGETVFIAPNSATISLLRNYGAITGISLGERETALLDPETTAPMLGDTLTLPASAAAEPAGLQLAFKTVVDGTVVENSLSGAIRHIEFSGVIHVPVAYAEVTSPALRTGVLAQDFNHQFTTTEGFLSADWSLSAPVPGLTLSSTGLLTGTPLSEGRYTVTLTASDAAGNQIAQEFTAVITAATGNQGSGAQGQGGGTLPAPGTTDQGSGAGSAGTQGTLSAPSKLAATGVSSSVLAMIAAAGALGALGALLRVRRRG